MGLVILFAVGGILGWLSTIILAVKERRATALYIGASVLGAMLFGLWIAPSPLIEAISLNTILVGAVGAITFFGVTHLARGAAQATSNNS
ncbi:hypothetical protein [Pontixanthobacter sp. CEM42]|uniref:hypothetical protein n=1 Tax=Pontixanthobacter sp. CEM42 TaxID=2792077 RepID=UPI001AE07729|nr:hypothetical protein [Pontixanthobacter sp. CEM42]